MSQIRMESQTLIGKCEMVLIYIEKMRIYYQEKSIKRYIKYKNSGFFGRLRKIFGKLYNRDRALKDLTRNYRSSFHDSQDYFCREETIVNSLIELAEGSPEVFLSREDFEMLNDIIHDAECIRRINERTEAL